VNRNHFGRQTESFETNLNLPFLETDGGEAIDRPFRAIFIRAPVVEKMLPMLVGEQKGEAARDDTVTAPPQEPDSAPAEAWTNQPVEIMATLPGRRDRLAQLLGVDGADDDGAGDIVAVKQGNVFGTSFHPELTQDTRIHVWWLQQVQDAVMRRRYTGKA